MLTRPDHSGPRPKPFHNAKTYDKIYSNEILFFKYFYICNLWNLIASAAPVIIYNIECRNE